MPKPSGSGHTVTLEAGGRVVTMTAEEFDQWCGRIRVMSNQELKRFLERQRKREEERR